MTNLIVKGLQMMVDLGLVKEGEEQGKRALNQVWEHSIKRPKEKISAIMEPVLCMGTEKTKWMYVRL